MTRRDYRRLNHGLAVARGERPKRPKTLRCWWCKAKITVAPRGPLPYYCSHGCRQRAYEQKKWNQPHLVHLRRDLASVATRSAIRREVWALLQEVGLVALLQEAGLAMSGPPDPPRPRGAKLPDLRVVDPDAEGD